MFTRYVTASFLLLLAAVSASAATVRGEDLTTYRNARHGYMISYPTELFELDPANESEDGRMLVSRDGRARLLMGAFENDEKMSLDAYRSFLIERNYGGAKIDYAPVRPRWFVVSGERDGTVFYERVTFTCGGRLINSWALLYPAAEKRRFDQLVEQVSRSYTAGAGAKGTCD